MSSGPSLLRTNQGFRMYWCARTTSVLGSDLALNDVHGLSATGDGGAYLLGDVSGNDQPPSPVLIRIAFLDIQPLQPIRSRHALT